MAKPVLRSELFFQRAFYYYLMASNLLLRLAWDASCSSFSGRQNLYEKFFSGDPWRNAAMRAERYPSAREAQDRVWAFLDRNGEWEQRINGALPTAA